MNTPMLPRILVVDDDPALRELLTDYLAANGFVVTAVADGAGMRAALADGLPDAVVLDLMLPGEDGLALTRCCAHSRICRSSCSRHAAKRWIA